MSQPNKAPKFYSFMRFPLILFLLLLLPLFTGCEKRRTVVNGIEEKEANEIIVLLSNRGIDANKVQSQETGGGGGQRVATWDIAVRSEDTTAAMSVLNNAGFPRPKSQNLLNIFSNNSLVPTDMGEKIRYQAGLASQVASTIRNIDGILDADVLFSIPDPDPLNPNAPKKDITASVYVKHSGVLDDPNSHLSTKIRNLVASSVSGLKYENVTLVQDRARFSDLATGYVTRSDENLDYVHLWGMTIAKNSVTTFRIIFFTFCFLVLLMLLSIIWIVWKVLPLLQEKGGIKELFKIRSSKGNKEEEESTDEKEEDSQKNRDLSDSLADESLDFDGELNVYDDEDER